MRKLLLTLTMLLFVLIANAQSFAVTGKVTDAGDGSPIVGATVVEKGTTNGIITDDKGKYTLKVNSKSSIIQFSFVGMNTVEKPASTSTINVKLSTSTINVGEVVVTAMGMKRSAKALGYSTQKVSAAKLQEGGNTDFAGALQGKVAGVSITPSSGMPGASSQITIRGSRSFTGDNTPLYVIDGMPISTTSDYAVDGNGTSGSDIANRAVDINPNDIESINILKGQAAAALYGIRASNGVIIITTKSGQGNAKGKTVVHVSNNTSFQTVSRTPELQTSYAQGSYSKYGAYNSTAWGPLISDLPNDAKVGGNTQGHNGQYYVIQREKAGLDPWATPQAYDNFGDYFQTGSVITNSADVSKNGDLGNFDIALGNTSQKGIVLATGMTKWNAKMKADINLNKNFKAGFSSNYVTSDIDKSGGGSSTSIFGVLFAPASYDLKGIPYAIPTDPYTQISYRSLTFSNPYWAAVHNVFNEKSDRFFGNAYLAYNTQLNEKMKLDVKYQLGADYYTTNYQDIYEYGYRGGMGNIHNYGITSVTYNSLLTANWTWKINEAMNLVALVGNEFNESDQRNYDEKGTNFNFGGWAHIQNAQIVTADQNLRRKRNIGTFGSLSFDYKEMLFLSATGRNDIVSNMPRNNRTFFYPSISAGFIITQLPAFQQYRDKLSFAKIRASYAQVGQAGDYRKNYYSSPSYYYNGGFFNNPPIQYPLNGINAYSPYIQLIDPHLKPQNTKSYELGVDLKFLNNRLGFSYTYSYQNASDQIFDVPLAGSSGLAFYTTNGGKMHTSSHELVMDGIAIQTKDFQWSLNANLTMSKSVVDELATGVSSIFLGGYTTPQVRAGIGYAYPVIYGSTFKRDAKGNVIVDKAGMPESDAPGVIGSVTPKFILGWGTNLSYKNWSLSATFDWKNGGQIYSGSNGRLNFYGASARTANRTADYIYPGVKEDGSKNDIVINTPTAYQTLYVDVLDAIDESKIYDNSFVKMRDLSLSYKFPKLLKLADLRATAYVRNVLIWTALPNFDPESSQGNSNMGGAFEDVSLPQTTSYGFGLDLTF